MLNVSDYPGVACKKIGLNYSVSHVLLNLSNPVTYMCYDNYTNVTSCPTWPVF